MSPRRAPAAAGKGPADGARPVEVRQQAALKGMLFTTVHGEATAAREGPAMTIASLTRVLVAGGTGGTGRLAVRRLGLLGIPTRILTRDRRRAAGAGPVEVVQGDALVEEDCGRAVDGCDGVICMVGVHKTSWKGPCVDGDGIINLARKVQVFSARAELPWTLPWRMSWCCPTCPGQWPPRCACRWTPWQSPRRTSRAPR